MPLPKDTEPYQPIDYSFLEDAGVPQEFKDKFALLRTEMDALLALQREQISNTQAHIGALLSWATVLNNVVELVKTIIPLIPVGTASTGANVTEEQKNCWLNTALKNPTQLLSTLQGFVNPKVQIKLSSYLPK